LSVSVVIPAYQCQPTLDLTLASLSRQTYPADLLEVVVVDDRSDPPLALPSIRPERTTLIRVDRGWGRANALHTGVEHCRGEILHWLDSDMLAYPDHVAAQARWQHVLPYAVTLGYKRFVELDTHGPWPSPAAIADAWEAGNAAQLFGGRQGEPHSYVERYIAQTDQLRNADHLAFRIHVGATAALTAALYEAAGGFDTDLRLGEDTEFGYRLAQAGAVFVPEPLAKSWHLGRTHVMRAQDQVTRYNRVFLADRVPHPRHWRKVGGPLRTVPLADVVIPVGEQPLERVRAAVDSVLRGSEPDVRVHLVGGWDKLDDARVPVLADRWLDLRLIADAYRGEPRLILANTAPASAFPAAYLLELPGGFGLAPYALRALIDQADRHQVGVVQADTPRGAVRLWRTAALGRAGWVAGADESRLATVTAVYGLRGVSAAAVGIVDLESGADSSTARGRRSAIVPGSVEVEGLRSLVRATVVVAWLTCRRLTGWLRGLSHKP
jgi:glycosyltransferase involved in cell wall biosynthesis